MHKSYPNVRTYTLVGILGNFHIIYHGNVFITRTMYMYIVIYNINFALHVYRHDISHRLHDKSEL